MEEVDLLQRLRKLIGRDCEHLGRQCRLIDILADEGALVVEIREPLPPIQIDQYGQAAYRGNELLQIPIFGPGRDRFSEEFLDLLACLGACGERRGEPGG